MSGASRRRILSGMQATGRLHLGNYLGALQNWVRLQDEYDSFFFVADWHALTTAYENPSDIPAATREILIDFLAAGLDPGRCTIFVQSRILEHAELHLLFSMFTPTPWLERVPSYKEKQEALADRDLTTYGFLGYPLLQAADILIYKADAVPVGIDQLPHLELTREVARRFNHLYRPVFPEPEALLTAYPKVPGLDGRKMSKSYDNAIYLSETVEEMGAKIKVMVTDPARKRRNDPGDPNLCPAFGLHLIFTGEEDRAVIDKECRRAGIGCVDCKKILIQSIERGIGPLVERRRTLASRWSDVEEAVRAGTDRARGVARETMREVREAMGLA